MPAPPLTWPRAASSIPPCVLVLLLSVGLYLFTQVNAIFLVLMGVISGLVIGEIYERKEGKPHGAA